MELRASNPSDFLNEELRAEAAGQASLDVHVLRALSRGDEVALVILSLPSGAEEAELEKLYVPLGLRKGGIASRALKGAEDYCRNSGRTILTLWANPLDDVTDQDWLIGWYRRRGYVDSGDGYAELQKTL